MTSARIELLRAFGGGLPCGGTYGVDRTKPAVLHTALDDRQWHLFCDDLDQQLISLNRLSSVIYTVTFLYLCCFSAAVVGLIGIPLSVALQQKQQQAYYGENTSSPWTLWAASLFGGSFLMLFVLGILGMCLKFAFIQQQGIAMFAVSELCRQMTERHKNALSFHVHYKIMSRKDRYPEPAYIQVFVDNKNQEHAYQPLLPTQASDTRTHPERLEQLESIRHLITESEYNQKRSEILASV